MKTAEQLRKQAAKLNNIGINSGSDLLVVKTKQLKQRAEKLEDAAKPAHLERSAGAIKLANRGTHAKVLVTLDDAAVARPTARCCSGPASSSSARATGSCCSARTAPARSRLMAMLRQAIGNAETAQDGIKATPSLVLGYGDQALADLDDADTPMETIIRRFEVGDQRARALLAGCRHDDRHAVASRVGRLSGGQKARLGMLVLRLARAELLPARRAHQPSRHRGAGSAGEAS